MPLSDLLDERRPHRADAAGDFDAILTAARAEFTERHRRSARRARTPRGSGPGDPIPTVPQRGDLIEAVACHPPGLVTTSFART